MENTITKTVVINGQEMVMSSVDGRTWFLRLESLYEFQERLRQTPRNMGDEIEELDVEPVASELVHVGE